MFLHSLSGNYQYFLRFLSGFRHFSGKIRKDNFVTEAFPPRCILRAAARGKVPVRNTIINILPVRNTIIMCLSETQLSTCACQKHNYHLLFTYMLTGSNEFQISIISDKGWVDPRTIVRPEGLSHWKIPVTPSGMEPATFQLVAQCPNYHPTLRKIPEERILRQRNTSLSNVIFIWAVDDSSV
jgi:hypothetical protein